MINKTVEMITFGKNIVLKSMQKCGLVVVSGNLMLIQLDWQFTIGCFIFKIYKILIILISFKAKHN